MTKDPKKKRAKDTTHTSAGAEAAEGLNAVSGQRGAEPTRSKKGAVREPEKPAADKMRHPGSEPLEDRTTEHESGYGGKGGQPRVSSDQREDVAPNGSLRSETNKR
jgi:hypothetical protein